LNLRRIDETVTSHPDVVIGLRKFGDQVLAFVIGNDDLDELGGKISRLRNDPHSRFRTTAAGDNATDIIAANANGNSGVALAVQRRRQYDNDYRDACRNQPEMNHSGGLHIGYSLSSPLLGEGRAEHRFLNVSLEQAARRVDEWIRFSVRNPRILLLH